jgi:two-component system response regulator AtoC
MPDENTKHIPGKKILVCDDDSTVSYFLKHFLENEGYGQVDTVSTGEEAIEKVKQNHYHLILLDIKLPRMNGIEVLKRIKETDSGAHVIMITAFPEMKNAEDAVKQGAYDYIVKPFDMAYLKLVVLSKMVGISK